MTESSEGSSMPAISLCFQQCGLFPDLPPESEMTAWVTRAAERGTSMTIRFVDEAEGLELNSSYRHKSYATNVLTFAYAQEPVVEADLAVCVPVLRKQAAEQGKTLRAHLCHLLVHGTLHAHGYDHETDEEAAEMEALETRILLSLGFDDPYEGDKQVNQETP